MLTDKEYIAAQERMIWISNTVKKTDFNGYLHRLNIENKAAKVLDPDLYGEGMQDVRALREVAEEFLRLQQRLKAIHKKWRPDRKPRDFAL